MCVRVCVCVCAHNTHTHTHTHTQDNIRMLRDSNTKLEDKVRLTSGLFCSLIGLF